MLNEISYEEAKKFSGYLEKKSKSILTKWQKRFFHILEGKIIVYAEKPDDIEIKGQFIIDQITMPESVDERVFKFSLEDRDFSFKAIDEKEKNKWMEIIKLLKNKLSDGKKKDNQNERSMNKRDSFLATTITNRKDFAHKSMIKKNKLTSAGKVTAEIIRRNGFVTNKEQKLSTKLLKSKGIDKLINLKDSKVNTRIYYGFIYKRHKIHDYFQKRWFFIFSSRPLFDSYYLEDDNDLDPKKQKDWIKFDSLFYFKYEDKDETSENLGSLELVNSHKVELLDKDEKYYLYLDVEDRRFDFYCDSKAERDIWFEVLKNSRRTAKEYHASITKHPRNIELLYSFFLLGEKEFIKKIEKEKTSIVGNYEKTNEFNIFEFNQNNLEYLIESTIDGCNSNMPPRKDLLKSYTEYMDKEYLQIIKSFWEKNYQEIQNSEILKISMMLFIFGDKLLTLSIDDQNFFKNGKELTKIYLKKTYQNVLSVIENILKTEREIKALKHEMGFYYTQGPNDLFEILSRTFDLIKDNKNKCLYELTLNLFNSSIKQYLLGVEAVLTNLDIILEKNYLLAVANNSLNMIELLNSLLDDIKEMKILTDQEINENIKLKKIMSSINKVSQKAITSFVFCFLNDLGLHFKDFSFISLDMTKILISTNEIFGPYRQYMNSLVLKKSWNEILKLTLYHYIHLLLTSNYSKTTVEQIKEKLKTDIGLISETYEGLVGKNLTIATIKILNDIHDFLDVSNYMISSSCLTLREYIGPTFDLSKAKALIKLRTDFNDEDKNDAIEQCREVLEKYQENRKEDTESLNYFQIIEKEMKRQAEEEKILQRQRTLQLEKMEKKERVENGQGVEGEEAEIEEDEIEEENEADIVKFDLEDFLNDDEPEENEEKKEGSPEIFKYEEEDKEVGQEEISDITHEGYMQKKAHSTYQTRFFQVKNGYLYWFKDKTSSIVQNKISIKNTLRVDSHKDKKFMMIVKKTVSDVSDDDGGESKKDLGGKVYKFSCQTEEEKNAWVSAITNEMKKIKKNEEKAKDNKLQIPVRKKIIIDYFNLPDINSDIYYMKKKVLEEMNNELFFQPSLRKIEALRRRQKREEKERKRKQKEEEERRKQEEKEERERKKREEKEEKERKKREEKEEKMRKKKEENKKIEEDMKSGKDVGIKNRLKFWFRTNVEGIKTDDKKEEENTQNKKEEIVTNQMSLADFGLDDDDDENNNDNNNKNENQNNDEKNKDNNNKDNNKDNNDTNNIKDKAKENNNINITNIDNNENNININDNENSHKKNNVNLEGVKKEEEIKINENKDNNIVIQKEKNINENKNNNNTKDDDVQKKEEKKPKKKRSTIKGWFKNTFNFGGNKDNKKEEVQEEEEKTKIKNEEINKKENDKKNKNNNKYIEKDIEIDKKEKIEKRDIENEKEKERDDKKERLEKEKKEREKIENERIEKERMEKERIEKERMEKEKIEKERMEKEKIERERIEQERIEKERIEKERIEKERMEKERKEKERMEKERIEKERIEKEILEKKRIEKERLERERKEIEEMEKEIEKRRLEKKKLEEEKEKLDREILEKKRLEEEQKRIEKERLEEEKRRKERERKEEEKKRKEKERIEKEKKEKERIEEEKRINKEKEIQRKKEKEKLELEKKRIEKEKQEKLKREQLEREKMENERKEKEKIERERIEKKKIEKERLEKETKEKERLEREKNEKENKKEEKLKYELKRNPTAEEEEKKRLEFNAKLLPKIRKDQRRAEKLHTVIYSAQNQRKIEEKLEKLRQNIPKIKTKRELLMEQNECNINNDEENKKELEVAEPPVKDWWGDLFKK